MNELALFAGAGCGLLGSHWLLGWRTVCAVEINPFCRDRLMQRQNEGHLPPFPIWDDVSTFDGRPWRGIAQVISGGFPCQDISPIGTKNGIEGEQSGLWKHMARIIREVRPEYVLVENSAALTVRGLGTVLGDLAEMGMDARWGVLSSCAFGAPHTRERMFIVANAAGIVRKEWVGAWSSRQWPIPAGRYRKMQRDRMGSVLRNAGSGSGHPYRVDRSRAVGNGQDPTVVAGAFRMLNGL